MTDGRFRCIIVNNTFNARLYFDRQRVNNFQIIQIESHQFHVNAINNINFSPLVNAEYLKFAAPWHRKYIETVGRKRLVRLGDASSISWTIGELLVSIITSPLRNSEGCWLPDTMQSIFTGNRTQLLGVSTSNCFACSRSSSSTIPPTATPKVEAAAEQHHLLLQ